MLEIEGMIKNVVNGYAPQAGCVMDERATFWTKLEEVVEYSQGSESHIGADFNRHVGEGTGGDEEGMGRFGVKERNLERQMVV